MKERLWTIAVILGAAVLIAAAAGPVTGQAEKTLTFQAPQPPPPGQPG